jgi:L-seryl-tRNA(Ser) seleniumtransferase
VYDATELETEWLPRRHTVAIKPPELLHRLPSVSELLDKPPVRALADRWNRSVVAGGVRSFLDELKNDLRRRAADVQLPSVRELAERAARYIVSRHEQQLGTAINATGRIWGAPWTSRPLTDSALERLVAAGREFVVDAVGTAAHDAELELALCRFTGAQAAVVVHSYPGAVWLALSTLAAGREVLVARAEVGEIGPGEPLPKLVASANARLREVGTTNRALAADYEAAASPDAAVVLTISPDEYRVVGETASPNLEELLALARDRELVLIAALGAAPMADPPATIRGWPQRSARDTLAAGVELVALRGDGLLGGPSCGILLGSRELIGRISRHPLFAAWRLDALRSAALAATLACYQDSTRGTENLPAWQLLSTPIENLRNRAERLAPQIAQACDVAAAVVVETRSPISDALPADGGLPSYGVALNTSSGQITDLDNRLRNLPLPILGRIESDRLILDLRTVLPRQDRTLVEAILGTSLAEAAQTHGGGQSSE